MTADSGQTGRPKIVEASIGTAGRRVDGTIGSGRRRSRRRTYRRRAHERGRRLVGRLSVQEVEYVQTGCSLLRRRVVRCSRRPSCLEIREIV